MPRVPALVTSPVGVSDRMICSTLGPDCASTGLAVTSNAVKTVNHRRMQAHPSDNDGVTRHIAAVMPISIAC